MWPHIPCAPPPPLLLPMSMTPRTVLVKSWNPLAKSGMMAAILTIKYSIVFFQNSSHNARNAVIPRDLREIQNFPRTPLGFLRHWRSCSEFMFALPWKVNTLARPVPLLLPRLASFICSWLVKISLLSLVRTVQFDSIRNTAGQQLALSKCLSS